MPHRIAAVGLVVAMFGLPFAATSQQAAKMPRIGAVFALPTPAAPPVRAFVDGMREHGFVEGRDYAIEFRSTGGYPERLPLLNAELAQLPVDVMLVGVCGAPLNAARGATKTIPIVVLSCNDDLVETGVIASLRRPGGNVTGLSKLAPELAPKRLQLLKQAVPGLKRVAVLWNPGYSDFKADWRELRAAASQLGVSLHPVEFRRPDELEAAFAAITREHVDALITFSDVPTYVHAKRVGELVVASRLPAMFAFREVADEGALMSYGPSITGMWRRGADYVARILRGANPAEMAIEQPRTFELVINLRTARALGVTIPPSLRLQAEQLID